MAASSEKGREPKQSEGHERRERHDRKKRMLSGTLRFTLQVIIFTALAVILIQGVGSGYQFGYAVFEHEAMEEPPGRERTIIVEEGDTVAEVSEKLAAAGLIADSNMFVVQKYFYGYDIYPGEYTFTTAMTPKEMLVKMSTEPGEEEDGEEE